MAVKKDKRLSKELERVFLRYRLDPRYYDVVQETPGSLIVRNKQTKELRLLEKSKIPFN